MPTIQSIHRYPVKGVAGQRLDSIALTPGEAIPMDRAFALRHSNTVFDPDNPVHMCKTKFLALMTHGEMAAFGACFSDDGTRMTLRVTESLLLTVIWRMRVTWRSLRP